MIKYKYKDDMYYITKNQIVDSTFIQVPEVVGFELFKDYCSKLDFNAISRQDFADLVALAKQMNDYFDTIFLCKKYMEMYDDYKAVRELLPRVTSSYRKLNNPTEAIEVFKKYYTKFGNSIMSSPLATSISAAYADVGEWDKADKYIRIAYATNNRDDFSFEIYNVKKRIDDNFGR